MYRSPSPTSRYFYSLRTPAQLTRASFSMSFGVDLDTGTEAAEPSSNSSQELRQLQPSLQSLSLAIDYRLLDDPKDQTSELRLIRGKKPLHTPSRGSDIIAEARRDFPFQVQHIDAESAKELLQQRPDSKIVGASVRHFFPFQIGVIFNKSKDIARKIASAVASLQSSELHFYYGPDVRSTIVPAAWSEFVLQTINNTITSQNETIPVSARTRSTLQHLAAALPRRDMPADDLMEALKLFLRRLDPRDRASIRSALAENQEKLELKFLESVREHQAGLQSFRSMRRIDARRKNASALRLRFSQSLASLRQRLSQAMVRSTTQRRGSTTNPLA